MPVGTQGTVKAVTHARLEALGATIILGNTYHLHLRPGDELIARRGGLHRFIGWPRPILTDSGGYQVFSLADRRKITEDGVAFTLAPRRQRAPAHARVGGRHSSAPRLRHRDGARRVPAVSGRLMTSRRSARCDRTLRWAAARPASASRRFAARGGATGRSSRPTRVRRSSASFRAASFRICASEAPTATLAVGFDGYAIGGLSVGEPIDVMYDVVEHTAARLPDDRPRYLMGAGTPDDLVECVARGIDMFDCVLPTRNARNGQLFTASGRLNIKNARFADDDRPAR